MRYGVDGADLRVLKELYWKQRAVVRVGDERSESVSIRRGVRQGCVLSPDLFSLYTQVILEEMRELPGIKIGGRSINNIRYADDMVMMAETEEGLQALMDKLKEECRKLGLRINIGKTEVMGVTKRRERLPVNITLAGESLKQVETFRYLGSVLSEDGRCESEIRTRIGMAKANFGKMRTLLTNLGLDAQLRLRILKCYIWSGLLYGCESWTLSAEMKRKLEAAEMWFLRRMWRVPWTARRTNVEVLQMANTSRTLLTTIRRRQ